MSPHERTELLGLLEQQARAEAEKPIDDREWEGNVYLIPTPPSSRVTNRREQARFNAAVERSLEAAAARSTDPEAFKVAWARYKPAFDRHFGALSDAAGDLIGSDGLFVDRFWALCDEARARTLRDGFPDPHETYCPAPPPDPALEPDPLDATRRAAMRHASLPRSVRQDIEDSRVVHAESATYESIRAEQQRAAPDAPSAEDKLDGFRGVGPLNWLVPGEDS